MSPRAILAGIPELAALTGDELDALVEALDVRDYPDRHSFIREGARGDHVFVVLAGTVSVVRERAGVEHELNRLGPGDLFGLVALADDAARSAACRAAGACTVGMWPSSVVKLLFHQRAPIARAFQLALVSQLARDFRQLDQRIRDRLRSS